MMFESQKRVVLSNDGAFDLITGNENCAATLNKHIPTPWISHAPSLKNQRNLAFFPLPCWLSVPHHHLPIAELGGS